MSDNQVVNLKKKLVEEYAARQQTDVPQPKEKYPTDVIPLATKGWFYPEGHPLASGEIELKQVTAREEDILANQELIKKGKVLDKLMESVIVNKAIKIEDILIPDKNAIFIAIRRLAYGDTYSVSITCPECGKKHVIDVDLSKLDYKPFKFEEHSRGQNNFTFKLPSGTVLTYKLLNAVDEQSIDAELTQLKKISKENSQELTTRLKYVITSVDGNPDRAGVRRFVEDRLTAKDSLALRKHMKETNPDVDMGFDYQCSECDFGRRMDVPIGASFLWPDIGA
jgi:T4 bacteriophage base plate protein